MGLKPKLRRWLSIGPDVYRKYVSTFGRTLTRCWKWVLRYENRELDINRVSPSHPPSSDETSSFISSYPWYLLDETIVQPFYCLAWLMMRLHVWMSLLSCHGFIWSLLCVPGLCERFYRIGRMPNSSFACVSVISLLPLLQTFVCRLRWLILKHCWF